MQGSRNVGGGGGRRIYSNGGAKSMESLDKSAESGIIESEKKKEQLVKELKGIKTANDVTIKAVSNHAADRMVERSITSKEVKSTLEFPSGSYPGNKPNSYCVQKNDIRVVYSDSGVIISVIKL